MIGSFKKAFKETHSSESKVPKGVLQAISKNLPDNIRYVNIGEGFCIITSDKEMNIRGTLSIQGIPSEKIAMCKDANDLLFYARNLQKNVMIGPDENGYIYVNDTPFEPSKFVQKPLDNLEFASGSFVIQPRALDETLKIPFSFDNELINVNFERVVFDSCAEMKFVSTNFEGLTIILVIHKTSGAMKITVTVSVNKSPSVTEVRRNISYYNYFVNGKVKIYDVVQNVNNQANLVPFDETAVKFWDELNALEKAFNVKFDLQNKIDYHALELIKQLFVSIVERKPFKKYMSSAVFSGKNEFDDPEEFVGKTIAFRYEATNTFNLLGVDLSLSYIRYVFDAKIKSCTYDESLCKFEVVDSDKGRMYSVTQFFNSENEIQELLRDEEKTMNVFRNAEELTVLRAS